MQQQDRQTKAQAKANAYYAQRHADTAQRLHNAAALLQQATALHAQLTPSSRQADFAKAYAHAHAATQQLCACTVDAQAHALGYSADAVRADAYRQADALHADLHALQQGYTDAKGLHADCAAIYAQCCTGTALFNLQQADARRHVADFVYTLAQQPKTLADVLRVVQAVRNTDVDL